MPFGIPKGAMCVQRFDDSLKSAIHTTYRISLRSSSMREPRDPLLKVLTLLKILFRQKIIRVLKYTRERKSLPKWGTTRIPRKQQVKVNRWLYTTWISGLPLFQAYFFNDPSAGSPTETLLRLLLPLNDQVWLTSWPKDAVAGFLTPIRESH